MSELITLWSGLLIVVALGTYIARRISLPAPVLLVLTGLLISFVPGLPRVALDPEMVLNVLLPLLIYSEAVTIPWNDFRRNLRPIGLLSIGLVAFTTLGVAWLARQLFPGMSWAVAFVLGAVISPPDDVAVAVVTERLPIPQRIVTVLEGEGLLNDVTALTIFRFGLAAAAGGALSASSISLTFLAMLTGGAAYGLLVGWLALKMRRMMGDSQLEITLSLVTPFVAYQLPELFGATGILSVVAAGILISAQSPRMIPALTRLQAHQIWTIVSFLLNGLLFLVLGLQLKTVTGAVGTIPLAQLAWFGAVFSVAVIALRFLWVYPTTYLSHFLIPSLRASDPMPPGRHLFLTAYTGMRGAISMAAALAIPHALPDGLAFPDRGLIVFITFSVILVTLIGQGLFLPLLVRALGIGRDGELERRYEKQAELRARIAATEAGMARLKALGREGRIPPEIVDALVREREGYRQAIARHQGGHEDADLRRAAQLSLEARQQEIQAERDRLTEMLRQGEIDDEVLVRIEHDLDLREARLEEHRLPAPNAGQETWSGRDEQRSNRL